MTDAILAERLAARHYDLFARDEAPPFDRAPGRKLIIEDAARWIKAMRSCGYDIVEPGSNG